jgi:PilZ domain
MSTSSSSSLADANLPQREAEAMPILVESCLQGTVSRLQLVHSGHPVTASLRSVSPRGLVLRVADADHDDNLVQHTLCCISFPYRTSLCAFLSPLIELQGLTGYSRDVTLAVPDRLIVSNLRRSFRVPVVHNSSLEVKLLRADQPAVRVITHNFSETGIEIEFANEPDSQSYLVGTTLVVELLFRSETLQLTGIVRHREDLLCGLSFQLDSTSPHARVQTKLHGIVLSLQQLWLKSRLK